MGKFNKTFNSKNPLKYGGTSGKEMAYSSAYEKSPLGYSPFKQDEEEEKEFSTKVDDPNRVNVSDEYQVGDYISEYDLESSFSQEGDDPTNYPQLSVQDYSKVREDDEGKYVVKIGEAIP